jgi:hypothetical protein
MVEEPKAEVLASALLLASVPVAEKRSTSGPWVALDGMSKEVVKSWEAPPVMLDGPGTVGIMSLLGGSKEKLGVTELAVASPSLMTRNVPDIPVWPDDTRSGRATWIAEERETFFCTVIVAEAIELLPLELKPCTGMLTMPKDAGAIEKLKYAIAELPPARPAPVVLLHSMMLKPGPMKLMLGRDAGQLQTLVTKWPSGLKEFMSIQTEVMVLPPGGLVTVRAYLPSCSVLTTGGAIDAVWDGTEKAGTRRANRRIAARIYRALMAGHLPGNRRWRYICP